MYINFADKDAKRKKDATIFFPVEMLSDHVEVKCSILAPPPIQPLIKSEKHKFMNKL